MPKATTCELDGQIVDIEEALRLRDEAPRRGGRTRSSVAVNAVSLSGRTREVRLDSRRTSSIESGILDAPRAHSSAEVFLSLLILCTLRT